MKKINGVSSQLICKMKIDVLPKGNGTSHIKSTCTKRSKVLVTIRC